MSILPDLYFTLRNIPAKPSGSLRSAGLVTHRCAFGAAAAFHSLSSFVQGLGDGDRDRDGATRASVQTLESAAGCGGSRRRLLCS
jgi:hypothetical protein